MPDHVVDRDALLTRLLDDKREIGRILTEKLVERVDLNRMNLQDRRMEIIREHITDNDVYGNLKNLIEHKNPDDLERYIGYASDILDYLKGKGYGPFAIQSASSLMFLTFTYGRLRQRYFHFGIPGFTWNFLPVENEQDTFVIQNSDNGLFICLTTEKLEKYGFYLSWTDKREEASKWTLKTSTDSEDNVCLADVDNKVPYIIAEKSDEKAFMDVVQDNMKMHDGGRIISCREPHGGDNQRWLLIPADNLIGNKDFKRKDTEKKKLEDRIRALEEKIAHLEAQRPTPQGKIKKVK